MFIKLFFQLAVLVTLVSSCSVDGGHSLFASSTTTKGTISSLSGFTVGSGTLAPAFDSSVLNYTLSVAYSVSSLSITPSLTQSSAKITVNGTSLTAGVSNSVNLSVGSNTLAIVVTAEDGTSTTYTVVVTRAAVATDANLTSLTMSSGALSATFSASTTSYTASISNVPSNFTVTPTASSAYATIGVRINSGSYGSVNSGSSSSALTPNNGSNTVDVLVTAEDGTTTKTYTITVTYGICGSGLYSDGVNACSQVGIGYWSPSSDNSRYACSNSPTNAHYTSPTASSASCPWSCDTGYVTTDGATCSSYPNATILACNDDEVAVGLYGRYGAIIDRLGVRCAKISANAVVAGTTRNGPDYGGNGGAAFNTTGTYDCPTGYALYEVDGSLATYSAAHRTGKVRYRCVLMSDGVTVSSWFPTSSTYWGAGSDRGGFNFVCGTSPNLYGSYINGIIIDNAAGAAYTGDTLGITCR